MGTDDTYTIGEIARACARIEKKVDDQGETITSVNLRLTAIEASHEPRRGNAKPVMAGTGLGAGVLWMVQWLATHWGKTP